METAAHSAFAQRMSASKEMERVRRLYEELAEQIPMITEFRKYHSIHKEYRKLTGKEKKKFAERCSYELQRYDELAEQLKARYPEKVIPTVEMVQKTLDNFQTEYDKASKEYQFYKKEMNRIANDIHFFQFAFL